MNCKHVQELLPLYVGRDLDGKRARLVTTHVQSCAECAGSLDEYHESRQLLQKFAAPHFSDAVYAGIRRQVLREIAAESNAPALTNLVANLFRPRIKWAVAAALLLAVAWPALYFIAGRKSQQLAGSNREIERTKQGEGKGSPVHGPGVVTSQWNKNSAGRKTNRSTTFARSVNRSWQNQRGKADADRATNLAANIPRFSPLSTEARESNSLSQPDDFPAPDDPAASEKPLRVEIQTKDPNIRIIWFSRQHPKQGSPNQSSKGI